MKAKRVRKTVWANKTRPANVLAGSALNSNAAVEHRYYAQLEHVITQMTTETMRQLRDLFATEHAEAYFAQDASISAQARILTNALTDKFNSLFAGLAKPVAAQMAAESDKASSAAVVGSLRDISKSITIPSAKLPTGIIDILSATTTENVGLIKSIPAQYLQNVQGAVMRSISTGNGFKDLVPFLQNEGSVTLRRARFIANDQTRKAFNNLSKCRMQGAGIKEYEWLHTGGSNHPRQDHIDMSGKIYRFDDPPVIMKTKHGDERGIPGQAPGCRCKMIPIVKFGDDDDDE